MLSDGLRLVYVTKKTARLSWTRKMAARHLRVGTASYLSEKFQMIPRDLTRGGIRNPHSCAPKFRQPFESTDSSSGTPAHQRSKESAERGADSNPEIARHIPLV